MSNCGAVFVKLRHHQALSNRNLVGRLTRGNSTDDSIEEMVDELQTQVMNIKNPGRNRNETVPRSSTKHEPEAKKIQT